MGARCMLLEGNPLKVEVTRIGPWGEALGSCHIGQCLWGLGRCSQTYK